MQPLNKLVGSILKKGCSLAILGALLTFVAPSLSIAPAHAQAPEATPAPMTANTKAAKDVLAKLADTYQKATDMDYKSTIVVNGPPTDDGKPGKTETLIVTGAAEKPNKFSVKAFGEKKKLAEFFYSDGNNAYQFDPLAGYYEQLPAPGNGLDIPQIHKTGLLSAADYATEFAAKMFFEDNPYDLSYAATDADTDAQFSMADVKIGSQTFTQITQSITDEKGTLITLRVSLDKTTNLPRRVSEDLTAGGLTRTVFTEDFDSIHVGTAAADLGTYNWQPPAGQVMTWTPPADTQAGGNAAAPPATGGN
ncbi:MAG TPA: hypothetical protein VFW40_06105 [Capsulimonadaceae bacterium]|nr:hypothetical protein [Capsulimonadaceae bacterium]